MCHLTSLFSSPKRGGILQSSGYLDLKSLMTLNRTCKAHAYDELSLILLIENEITRHRHGVRAMDDAVHFLEHVYSLPVLKRWLERDSSTSITINQDMLTAGVKYEVMFVKMLHAVPESKRLQMVSEKSLFSTLTLLHRAAKAGNVESIKAIVDLYPESERFRAVSVKSRWGTVLHCAAESCSLASFEFVLALFPESERLRVAKVTDPFERTVLHYAIATLHIECICAVLSLYPESERRQALNMKGEYGGTLLEDMTPNTRDSILAWLSKSESSEHSRSTEEVDVEAE